MKSKRHFIPGSVGQIYPAQNQLKERCPVKRLTAIVLMLVLLLSCCGICSEKELTEALWCHIVLRKRIISIRLRNLRNLSLKMA